MKKKFLNILQKIIDDKNCQDFLHTLLTGDNTHKFLTYSFSKVGLQHVLAISGFHFGVLTIFFSYILRFFLPQKIVCYLLILIINFYFLFVGPLVSVERSYIMIFMALGASLVGRKYSALNALGISAIIILILNPLNISNAGFQLSFLSTFAILIGFVTFDDFFDKFIKKRSVKEKENLSPISRFLEKIFIFIRGSICLSFVVNILITPVVLYNFHKFSYLGFIYNLFIPFLVGISMMIVIFAIFFYFTIPPLGIPINYLATKFTKLILQFTTYPPAKIQFYLRCKNLSFEFVIAYLAIVCFLFIYLRYNQEKKNNPNYFDLF